MNVQIHRSNCIFVESLSFRGEYNVAVVQLETKLEMMTHRPICLPPKCDHDCRTRNGKTREDLIAFSETMTIIETGFMMDSNSNITNVNCEEFDIGGIKRLLQIKFKIYFLKEGNEI